MKNVLITGANNGIGLDLAKLFLEKESFNVFALSRSRNNLQPLADSPVGSRLHILQVDLKGDAIGKNLIPDDIPLDMLINNAGCLINKKFEETTSEDWEESIAVNLYGPVKIIKAVLPNLKKAKNSHILNISSMGGFLGTSKFPGLSAYSSSKAALTTLTECLAVEFGEFGIFCNCLCLGAVNTMMLNKAFPGYEAPLDASEMAEFIFYFSNNGHRFFNGKALPVALTNPD